MDAALFLTNDELDSAFQTKEFAALFQPTVSLARLRAVQAGASLQWHHPALGVLDEPVFSAFVTELGRRRELTLFTLRTAVRACAQWRRDGLDWSVSVRIAPIEFLDGHLVASIGQILNESNLNPADLTIEIRETDIVEQVSQLLPAFTELRTLGCGLNLYTGAALTLTHEIRNLPLTELTITGGATLQFIQRTRQAQYGLFAQRLAEAEARNIRAVAAGVEDEATLWAIQRAGFSAATGSYICRPLPAKGLVRWNTIWQQAAETIAASKRAQSANEAAPEPEDIAPPPPFLQSARAPEAEPPTPSERVEEAVFAMEAEPYTSFTPSPDAIPDTSPPAFLHRASPADLPMDIDETLDLADASMETADAPTPETSAEETLEALREALAEEPPALEEPGDGSVSEFIEESSISTSFDTEFTDENELEPEPAAAREPASRIDLSQWISTRSQGAPLAHNPLDDYFEGNEAVPPSPTAPSPLDAAEDSDDDADDEPIRLEEAPELPPIVRELPRDIEDFPLVAEPMPTLLEAEETAPVEETAEADEDPLPPKVAPARLLEPTAARTVSAGTPDEPAEPVLIARKLRGLDKPIVMAVQNPGREGLSLRGLFKKRSGK